MGLKYNLSKYEYLLYKLLVLKTYMNYINYYIEDSLFLFIIRIYEFLDMASVNNTGITSSMVNIRGFISSDAADIICRKFYRLRNDLVHNSYKINYTNIELFKHYKELDSLVLRFDIPIKVFENLYKVYSGNISTLELLAIRGEINDYIKSLSKELEELHDIV